MVGADPEAAVATVRVPGALNRPALAALLAKLSTTLAHESLRVLVLRGSSEGFCSGMDLGEIAVDAEAVPAWREATTDFVAVLRTIREAGPITIAVVEGPAMGGGVGLLAACDLVLATESSTFSLPELLLGLVPAMILPILAERLGLHQAKRWAITQATWQAGEAGARGLVDQVVSKERIDSALKRMLRTFTRLHPRGVLALKGAARNLETRNTVSAMAEGQELLVNLLSQADVRADVVAFRDFGILPGQIES